MTNTWAGQKSQRLAKHHQQMSDEDGISYFGNVTLCTMVNAQPYIDEDQNINREEEGVDELIEGIMSCLDDDGKVLHWCMAVIERRRLRNHFRGKLIHD